MADIEAPRTYDFLSPEWIEAVKDIRDEYAADGMTAPVELSVNLVVTDVPFSELPLRAHVDTSGGGLVIEQGHLDSPDLSVTVDWMTAKAMLVDGNPGAAMGAFMEGKIRVEGDVSKLVSFQGGNPDGPAREAADRIRALTS